jgi:hypothetical protein
MTDAPRGRVSLLPVISRADEAADAESFSDPPVRVGVGRDDWLVMADGGDAAGAGGRWLASDTTVDLDAGV